MSLKKMYDTMDPDRLVPTLLAFSSLPNIPITATDVCTQRESMAALKTAREEMSTLGVTQRISTALSARLPPATRYLIHPGDRVRIYRECSRAWEGPFLVIRDTKKQSWIVDQRDKAQLFRISQLLPERSESDNRLFQHDHEGLGETKEEVDPFHVRSRDMGEVSTVHIAETLHPAEPRR